MGKFLDLVKEKASEKHYSPKTTEIYIKWIKRFIIFNKKQHPSYLKEEDVIKFLNYLGKKEKLSGSTQQQAYAALAFLYYDVLQKYWIMNNLVMVKRKKVDADNRINLKKDGSKLKVFLCHANEDKPTVKKIYKKLSENGAKPWLDDEDLIGGQEWEIEIEKAVKNSDVVIVCISNKSITKTGYVQKEIKFALDVADKQPEDSIFIIPLRLEDCLLPERLKKWQAIDSFRRNGYRKLKNALNKKANTL